ncbi:hypothetical protein [Daejeonella sp.]|uniref:hypothetical protein n=1 Tax=Daejeonella sp. TaxID=2805397 RepID=UPI0030BEF1A1
MIEVFRTNVDDPYEAARLIEQVERLFSDYAVNFDLEDCDRIMRVKSETGEINSDSIIALLTVSGFDAEVLEDEIGNTMIIPTAIIHP